MSASGVIRKPRVSYGRCLDRSTSLMSQLLCMPKLEGGTQVRLKNDWNLASFRMLDVDEDAQQLAQKLIDGKGIPKEYPEDALHIALAAVNGMDVIVTWNFAHLNNPFTRVRVRAIVETEGYSCPEICSPEELLEGDQ